MYGSTSRSLESRSDGASSGTLRRVHNKGRVQVENASIQTSGAQLLVGPGSGRSSRTTQNNAVPIRGSAGESSTGRARSSGDVSTSASGNNITLRKELNLVSGTAVVVGLMIGSGIFITPSDFLHYSHSFGLTMVLWTAGGVIALFGGLCFCELATLVKKSGSTYAFILEGYSFRRKNRWLTVLGSLLAFVNIWSNTLIGQPTGIAVALLTFGRYLCRPFFIGCSEVPMIPVRLLAFSALGEC